MSITSEDILECIKENSKVTGMLQALRGRIEADPTNPLWEKQPPGWGTSFSHILRIAWLDTFDTQDILLTLKNFLESEETR